MYQIMNLNIFGQSVERNSPDKESKLVFDPSVLIFVERIAFRSELNEMIPCNDSEEKIDGSGVVDFPDFELPDIVSLV